MLILLTKYVLFIYYLLVVLMACKSIKKISLFSKDWVLKPTGPVIFPLDIHIRGFADTRLSVLRPPPVIPVEIDVARFS